MNIVQMIGVTAALASAVFWLIGAGIRIRPLSLWTLVGPESLPSLLNRQSLMNAVAAMFASIAAACQAADLYFR
ncbi:MAG TPA: hypothetical protein VNK52_13510 [Hyphomicrobiaceae bacterium]|nr:hypothetical protein [Hyphomicrobiaceae bacterium]